MSVTDVGRVWTGEFRKPRNSAAEVKGSIHDDATASKLGFKGGTVAGSIHMDQFVPGLLELYGDALVRDRGHVALLHPGHGGRRGRCAPPSRPARSARA